MNILNEYSQIKERLDDHVDNNIAHENLAGNRPGSINVLKNSIGDTSDIVDDIDSIG